MGCEVRKTINLASKTNFEAFPNHLINDKDIKNHGYKFFMRNDIPKYLNDGCYLYNLGDKNSSGTHWQSFIISKPYLFHYDPYGTELNGLPTEELKHLAKRMNLKIISNPYNQQPIKSYLCGYYCLYICDMLKPFIGSIDPSLYYKTLIKAFGKTPDKGDVIKLMSYFHKIVN